MSNYNQFRILKSNACSLVGRPQKGMRQPKSPVSFETWFLMGLRRVEWYGGTFELLEPAMVRIQWLGKPAILRTLADFKHEYENEYRSKFQPVMFLKKGL